MLLKVQGTRSIFYFFSTTSISKFIIKSNLVVAGLPIRKNGPGCVGHPVEFRKSGVCGIEGICGIFLEYLEYF